MVRSRLLVIVAATAALIGIAPFWSAHASKPTDPVRLKRLRYEEIQPYLEARYTIREGRLWLCTPTNFAKIPHDPLLEQVSRETAELFWATGQKITPFIDLSTYRDADSPWGAFADPRIRALVTPSLEEARAKLLRDISGDRRGE